MKPSPALAPRTRRWLGGLALVLLAATPRAHAELERWVDAQGRLHVRDGSSATSDAVADGPRLLPRINCPEARERFGRWRASRPPGAEDADDLELLGELAQLCPSDARLRSARDELLRRRDRVALRAEPPAPAPEADPGEELARALALFHEGHPVEARDRLRRLERSDGHADPEIGYQLGLVELASGHGAEAIELIERYLWREHDLEPQRHAEAQAALETARRLRDERALYEAVEGGFESSSTQRFRFLWDGATAERRELGDTQREVERYLELAYAEVGRDLGAVYPREPVEVVFYSPAVFDERFSGMTRFAGFWDGSAIRVKSSLKSADAIQDLLYHEYTHVLVDHLAGGRGVPSWLNEGLAEIEERRAQVGLKRALEPRDTLLSNLAEQTLRGDHPPLASFERHGFSQIEDAATLRRTYSRAYVAVSYLHERVGMRGIVRVLRGIGSGKPYAEAFGDVYTGGPEAFERDFRRHLERQL